MTKAFVKVLKCSMILRICNIVLIYEMAKKKINAPAPYRAHRERQRRRIQNAAKILFDQTGIDRVTMAEITVASGVQASTIYQYFSSKDEIVWAIARDVLRASISNSQVVTDAAPNALARIKRLFDNMADDLVKHQSDVRFMAQFDAMYARDWPTERLLTLESQIYPEGFRYFSALVRAGIKDGSLRSDLKPDLTMQAILNAVAGAQRRLASLGSKVEQEYGQPIDQLFRETLRIILLGLSAPGAPAIIPQLKAIKARKSATKRKTP
ncbi:MAG: TetR/AcrR family transcriptional regulator [Granulicella sp.]